MLSIKRLLSGTTLLGVFSLCVWLVGGCALSPSSQLLPPPNLPPDLREVPDFPRIPFRGESLSLLHREVIQISPDGLSSLTWSLSTTSPALTDLYQKYWEQFEADPAVREDFFNNIQQEYATLLGTQVEGLQITSASLAVGAVEFHMTGQLPYATTYDTRSGEWHVAVGPQIPEAVDSIGNQFLTELIFRAFLLESLEGQQRFELHRETRFELPKGAVLANRQELEGLKWNLDLGGGTSLRATLKLEDQAVTVVEDLIQTEAEPTNLMTEEGRAALFDSLSKYKSFAIKYAQDPQIATPLAPRPVTTQSRPDSFSRSWQLSVAPTVYVTFDDTHGLPRGSSFTLSANPSFTFGTFLGWRFSRGRLEWFNANITVNPGLTVTGTLNLNIGLSRSWTRTRTVWSFTRDFFFWIGILPVWIRLKPEINVTASLSAGLPVELSASTGLGVSSTTGVLYDGSRWRPQANFSVNPSSPSFNIRRSNPGITASVGPILILGAYVYNLAGPFVSLGFSLNGQLSVLPRRTWTLSGLVQATGGFRAATWFNDLLRFPIPSLNYDFFTWQRELRSGTW
jgi:hypothetical protein